MKKGLILIILLVFIANIYAQTRKPAVAGRWYPGTKKQLEQLMENLFKDIDLEENKNLKPFGLISPHAGLTCSGRIAAYGYSLLKENQFDTVILLGPSHNYFKRVVSVYNGDYCETPLGTIPIDKEISGQLVVADKKIVFDPDIHSVEHSLEAQLPFLQYKLKSFKVVLILTSTNDFSLLDKLAQKIIEITEKSSKKILFVNSTDMSHDHKYDVAVNMDYYTIDLIIEQKWDTLKQEILSRNCELCGYYALYPFLKIMKHYGNTKGILLKYANSGDVFGDINSRIVGYCSIIFPQKNKNIKEGSMNEKDKKYLLNSARESIAYYLKYRKIPEQESPQNPLLSEDRAVFVTLHQDGNLRGCIGHMQARMPMYKAIAEMAVSAAFEDYRFTPVREQELENVQIEISVLSPMQRIFDHKKIRMGIDGVWIKKGMCSGVYLPQVATETGWDRKTFLESLCAQKAGLDKDAYLDPDTEIYIYQVEKFSE